ncbi:MAG: UbiX family flavin prenyltransferase [Deltaproteobacteria bacterium]|nr:UbiX family flavin prenyltransferase [Deltaproteobacteria bacterium]
MGLTEKKHLILAATGASGAMYFVRTLRALLMNGHQVDLVISSYGLLTLREETSFGAFDGPFAEWFFKEHGPEVRKGELTAFNYKDQTTRIASGSSSVDGMAIVPCTMRTLAGVAHGFSSNLIERAADVVLKERKRLVVVPREAPYNLFHLENMTRVTQAGAVVLPASPAFYQKPESLTDLGDFIAARVLKLFDLDVELYPKWQGLTHPEELD